MRIESDVSPSLPSMTVDGKKFARIFDLLLKDEAISLPDKSVITIKAEAVAGNSIKVEIRDSGPRLFDNELRSVFNPFFVRKDNPQEFGINLMTCYFLVYHHGGTVEVLNDEKGTVFKLVLPITPPAEPDQKEDREFVAKVLANEELWEKLLAGD
jgi:K+-sensing histidine kinase KdpD